MQQFYILRPLLGGTVMSLSKGFLLVVFLLLSLHGQGQDYTFNYTDEARAAYEDIKNLKLKQAYSQIEHIKAQDPTNLVYLHLENYIDFFYLFINEDLETYKKKKRNRDYRIETLDRLSDDDPNKAFAKAEILLQWSLVKMKFDEKFDAGRDIVSASSLLESNYKRFPDFVGNLKSLSIIHVLGESLPAWLRTLTGIKGSIKQGLSEIEQISTHAEARPDYLFREEVATIHAYTLFYQLNQKKEALEVLNRFDLDHTKSPLINFVLAGMHQRLGNNDLSIEILNARPKGREYSEFVYLELLLGVAKLNKLDASCIGHMNYFINNFRGQHYIKEAYQKLAWAELVINDDYASYKMHMGNVQQYGQTLLDEDSQALAESKSNTTPNPELLKARILFDGGYYGKAHTVLIKSEHKMRSQGDKIEFSYRLGRILQNLNNPVDAIQAYQDCYTIGKRDDAYFATSAALNLGQLYEVANRADRAKIWYRRCLDLDPGQYRTSLHQKAKTGLSRLPR